LLCDGSYYRSTDFPELAKILHNETIHYWLYTEGKKDSDSFIGDEDDDTPAEDHMKLQEEKNYETSINIYRGKFTSEGIELAEKSEPTRVFRVPDLRGMFIQSAITGLTQKNTVGEYERDCIKDNEIMIKHGMDRHYHYIVLDSPAPNKNTVPGELCEIIDGTDEGIEHLLDEKKVAALARYGAMKSTKKTHWYGSIKTPKKSSGSGIATLGNTKVLLKKRYSL
jgi:hypothetical protein